MPGATRGGALAAAAAALFLAVSCAKPPVREELTIELSRETDSVFVTAETTLDMLPRSQAAAQRVESARNAIAAGTDPWAVRLARVMPQTERVTFDRTHGELERVTRSARIAPDELQQIFADTSVTVSILRGDGWRELAFYTGTSSRGSREQQRRFDESLERWSRAVARYVQAIGHLYAYLDEQPGRARWIFASLLNEKRTDGSEPLVLEEEQPLVDEVVEAMVDIAERLDREEESATLGELADLLFNPLPARIAVRLPGEVVASQGFAARGDSTVVVEPVDLLASLAELEGRWVEPDPLASLLRDETPSAEQFATLPRRARPVTSSSEIAAALREQLVRPRSYVVRWRE